MKTDPAVTAFRDELSRFGFNLYGTVSIDRYDRSGSTPFDFRRLFPPVRSILLVASGGPQLWREFKKFSRGHINLPEREKHPLDAWTRRRIEKAAKAFDAAEVPYALFYPFVTEPIWFPFGRLGELAGLGVTSPLGILVHPRYGPWFSFRGGVLLPLDLPEEETKLQGQPCSQCPRDCLEACVGNASDPEKDRIDFKRCIDFRTKEIPCRSTCHARLACPVGQEYRYPDDEIEYHYSFEYTIGFKPEEASCKPSQKRSPL